MGYVSRFNNAIQASDIFAMSLPILCRVEGICCEALFFYTVRDGKVELLGDVVYRGIATGKITEKKIKEVLTAEQLDRVLSLQVDYDAQVGSMQLFREYVALHDGAVETGGRLEPVERQVLASLLVRIVPPGGLLALYRALATELPL